ncbi:hypothetical protein DFH08DRAFT_975520 [Mycena albidolilacea]|uniref:Secreted protein n=1 Tax=Mycena albidolilacea TaxID=1033008 RepID=A0AAD6Z501_9AGAR|nr:hypothetical protein DFH08DRAFT_975520 [Mycena albidolilacea]
MNGHSHCKKVSTLSLLVTLLHSTPYLLFRSPGATPSHPSGDALSTELLLKAFARTIAALAFPFLSTHPRCECGRIETDVRPLVRSAVQSSLATVRTQHKKGTAPAQPASSAAPTNSKTLKSAPASKSKSTPASKTTSTPDPEAAPPPIDKHASRPK